MIRGFTLIELLICLAIVSLVVLFSMPETFSHYHKNQLKTLKSELITAIAYARNEALLRGQRLALAPLDSKNWSEGMMLFIDNKEHQYRKREELIHQWQWHSKIAHLSWKGFRSDNYLIFAPDIGEATCSGHFKITNAQGEEAILIINRIGRIREG